MPTVVTAIAAAPSEIAREHFAAEFTFETDCWDVHDALSREPDFVLLDLMLPDGSGLDFLARIRRRDEAALVAVLSAASDDLIARAALLKPDALFRKPVDLPVLLEWLKNPIPQSFKPPVVSFRHAAR